MAGFQLTLYGRIWVTPEVSTDPHVKKVHTTTFISANSPASLATSLTLIWMFFDM